MMSICRAIQRAGPSTASRYTRQSIGRPLFASPLKGPELVQPFIFGRDQQQQQLRYRSNRSRRGLYDGKDVRFGNNVSFSGKKTRRKFKPNVQHKAVYSEILDEMIKFHLTTKTLRSIDKAGGLDNYLLTSKHVREGEGLRVRTRIRRRMKQNEKKVKRALERGEEPPIIDQIAADFLKSTSDQEGETVSKESAT